jgi:oligosaccharide 4-alpha-D-glucosyltransferase
MPVYVKAGSFIPMWENNYYTSTAKYDATGDITVRYYPSAGATSFVFFDDDGKNPQSIVNKQFQQLTFRGITLNNICSISIEKNNWPAALSRNIVFNIPSGAKRLIVDNKELSLEPSGNGWKKATVVIQPKMPK